MIEQLFIVTIFAAAAFYLGRRLYMSLRPDKGCAKGCGCAADDLKKGSKLAG
jgi:hypothetical protein